MSEAIDFNQAHQVRGKGVLALKKRSEIDMASCPRREGDEWSQRVGAFALLPTLIRGLGADPDATLASAGLSAHSLDNPDARIPYSAMGILLRESTMATCCAHLGLLAGRMWRLADLGLVGELVRHAPTVGEALHELTVAQQLNGCGGLAFLLERGGTVDLGYAIYYPGYCGADQTYDTFLAAGFSFLRELCGSGWVPSEVFIPHSRPPDDAHYRNLFKVHPRFNSEIAALRFHASWLERVVPGCDPIRYRRAQERFEQASPQHVIETVCRALRTLLLRGKNSGDDVAYMLSMHRRTLNRRLKAAGTTFQALLDQIRFEVAQQLLAYSDIAADDIAASLGYASLSPFMRSFRRWSGATPGQWRASHAHLRSIASDGAHQSSGNAAAVARKPAANPTKRNPALAPISAKVSARTSSSARVGLR
jgi:AraC-like DNA-binding protein